MTDIIVMCPVSRYNPKSIDSMLSLDHMPLFYLFGRTPIARAGFDHYTRVKYIAEARNELLKRAMLLKWDYALFLDDDMVVNPLLLHEMLKHVPREKVVAVPYTAKEDPSRTLTVPGRDPAYAKHTGFGCILMAREILSWVGSFSSEFTTPDMSEDVNYCDRINMLGYRIFILNMPELVKHEWVDSKPFG